MNSKLQFNHKVGMKCKIYLTSYEDAMRFKEDKYTFGTIKRVIVYDETYTYFDIHKNKHTANKFELVIKPLKKSLKNHEVDKFLSIEKRSNSPYKVRFLEDKKELFKHYYKNTKKN